MVTTNGFLAVLAEETTRSDQTVWFPLLIALVILGFVATAFSVRRARQRHREPPAGSVPASEVRRPSGS